MPSKKKSPTGSPAPARKVKLTLNDVALALGVSRTTVSNAFNRPEQLSKTLREDILTESRQLGYFGPDPAARAMRRREIREVAVVFHHGLEFALSDPLSIEFVRGVAAELDRRGMVLQLIPKMGRTLSLAAAFQTTADALIVHAEIEPDLAPEVRATAKPLALVDTHVPGIPSIRINDRQGAMLAMDYALAPKPDHVLVLSFTFNEKQRTLLRGTTKIARTASVGMERMAGYLEAAAPQGWDISRFAWLEIDDEDPTLGADRIARLLKQLPAGARLSIAAMTDRMALTALQVLKGSNRCHAVAVVGFDDIPAAATAGLTTIRQDAKRKGELAVQIVLDGGKSVSMPLELVVRNT